MTCRRNPSKSNDGRFGESEETTEYSVSSPIVRSRSLSLFARELRIARLEVYVGLFRTVLPNRIHHCIESGFIGGWNTVKYCNLIRSRQFNFFHGSSCIKPKRIGSRSNLFFILAENTKVSNIRETPANPFLSVPLTSSRFRQGFTIYSVWIEPANDAMNGSGRAGGPACFIYVWGKYHA